MCRTALHRAARGGQCLAKHLTTEDLWRAYVTALATEDVFLDGFEFEQGDQVSETCIHWASYRKRGRDCNRPDWLWPDRHGQCRRPVLRSVPDKGGSA